MSYIFSKNAGQRVKNAVTPIKMMSCVFHAHVGHSGILWDSEIVSVRLLWFEISYFISSSNGSIVIAWPCCIWSRRAA